MSIPVESQNKSMPLRRRFWSFLSLLLFNLTVLDKKGIGKKVIFFILFILAVLPLLFFVRKPLVFLHILNFSAVSVIAVAFEFGYFLSYAVALILTAIIFISMIANPGFEGLYVFSVLVLNIIPLVPSYCNRLYNKYLASKNEVFERERDSLDRLKGEFKNVREINLSFQNQACSILELYEVTKKIGVSMNMADMLAVFGAAVEKFINPHNMSITLTGRGQEDAVVFSTYKIEMVSDRRITAEDIKSGPAGEFERVLFESVSSDKTAVYLNPPLKEGHPLGMSLDAAGSSFAALPLLSEGTVIGVVGIFGIEARQIENVSILVEQLALEVKKINLYEKIQELAITDGLTGIYVRRHFLERLNEELPRIKKYQLKLSVLMIDLDHFKKCNDTYGHLVGDIVLKETARIMRDYIRQVDLIGRYGGEEFIIALPDTDKENALHVAERIRASVDANSFKAYDETINMTVSIGVAACSDDCDNVNELIDRADRALYKAKGTGRNKTVVY